MVLPIQVSHYGPELAVGAELGEWLAVEVSGAAYLESVQLSHYGVEDGFIAPVYFRTTHAGAAQLAVRPPSLSRSWGTLALSHHLGFGVSRREQPRSGLYFWGEMLKAGITADGLWRELGDASPECAHCIRVALCALIGVRGGPRHGAPAAGPWRRPRVRARASHRGAGPP